MTVSAQITINEYVADGVVIIFPFTFKVVIESDLKVFIDDVLTTTGYEVNGLGEEYGGDITFITEEPPVNGTKIRLERHVPFERSFDYLTGGPLEANTLDNDIDRVVMMLQDLGTQTNQVYETFSESITNQINDITADIAAFQTSVNNEIITFKNDVNADIASFESGINNQIATFQNDMDAFESSVNASVTTMTNNMNTVMNQLYWIELNQFDIIDGGTF
jgi:hypothetical protein